MSKFFKPEDFEYCGLRDINNVSSEDAARRANAKLEREGKAVYAAIKDTWMNKMNCNGHETHTALLINIEEIKAIEKPECKHEVFLRKDRPQSDGFVYYCSLCNQRVTPTSWEVSKKPILETEMLTDPVRGIYTRIVYYDDGSTETLLIPKGAILMPTVLEL